MAAAPKYKRILLKLSGEALMGAADYGIDPKVLTRLANEALEVQRACSGRRPTDSRGPFRSRRPSTYRQRFHRAHCRRC